MNPKCYNIVQVGLKANCNCSYCHKGYTYTLKPRDPDMLHTTLPQWDVGNHCLTHHRCPSDHLPVSVCGSSPDRGVPALLTSASEPVVSEPPSQHGSDLRAPPPAHGIIIVITAIHFSFIYSTTVLILTNCEN